MMRLLKLLVFVCLCMSCQDEISFETQNVGILVVDGSITNEPGPHIVRLSRTARFGGAIEERMEEVISGATVRIEDNTGVTTELTELQLGDYSTPESFLGIVGRTYTLCFTTTEGLHYQSEPETLPASGENGDVYYEIAKEEVVNAENRIIEETRVNFYSDFSFPDKDYYYRWDWDGTYILETTFPDPDAGVCEPQSKFPKPAPPRCYVTEKPGDGFVRLMESNNSSALSVNRFLVLSSPINYNWDIRYSMHLTRFSMTYETNEFWRQVLAQKEQRGSIFDAAPSTVRGNISNVNDPEEVVLGNFAAYGLQDTRVFVPGFNFPDSDNSCRIHRIGGSAPAYCCDCRFYEPSTADKPGFWID